MIWLALGAGLLALFVALGRASARGHRSEWRAAAAFIALAGLVAGAAMVVRGAYGPGAACLLGALVVATLSRRPERARRPSSRMAAGEARALLGVDERAGPEEIQAAYVRLMRRVHPDAGGASGLAAQLNAARDRLLEEKGED